MPIDAFAPSPTRMPSRARPPGAASSRRPVGEIAFRDRVTGRTGWISQQPVTAVFVFHPDDGSDPVPVDTPGRFVPAATHSPAPTGHAGPRRRLRGQHRR